MLRKAFTVPNVAEGGSWVRITLSVLMYCLRPYYLCICVVMRRIGIIIRRYRVQEVNSQVEYAVSPPLYIDRQCSCTVVVLTCFVMCECVCVGGVVMCVCVGFVMCGCVYVCVCVCVGFVMCGCVYVWVL
jgi:hypothetical protein